ncbi:MAG: pyruvate ferredoxin oxidoreductase subunit gamma [Patescibacteria group bacterium]|nr:pyruvate ferredoxin oxidoreductase subunit gamma [Patescibacteria group bacterium]
MLQVRIHGRGGQGVVTAAELIAIAAFKDGKQAQAFPFFGVERIGTPVESYVRIDNKPIIIREQIYQPDILIIQDQTLLDAINITNGCAKKTIIIINTEKNKTDFPSLLKKFLKTNMHTIDATRIAMEILGKNIVNTVILGAFAKATNIITLESLKKAIEEKFADKDAELIAKNIKTIKTAYNILSKL